MVLFNYSTKEITAKVVYYGPGLCGKTTNLQFIYDNLPGNIQRGRMLSLATKTDRTLFFDFLPIDLGTIRGMRTRVQLYTVPGQVFYNSTRKLVLKGADGIVFVADSQEKMKEPNAESFKNLEENCAENGINLAETPLILQFNKRDLPGVASLEELNTLLNKYNAPFYESVATTGIGVHETLKGITKLVLHSLREKYAGGEKEARRSSSVLTGAPPAPPAPEPLPLEEETAVAASLPDTPAPVGESAPIAVAEEPLAHPALSLEEEPAGPFDTPKTAGGAAGGGDTESVEPYSDLESVFSDLEQPEAVETLDLGDDGALAEEPDSSWTFPDPTPEPPLVEGLLSRAEPGSPAPREDSFADLADELSGTSPAPPPRPAALEFEADPLGLDGDGPAVATAPTVSLRAGTEVLEIPLEIDAGGTVERYRLRLRISVARED
jgi:signal recognition particle receptor subunit beta